MVTCKYPWPALMRKGPSCCIALGPLDDLLCLKVSPWRMKTEWLSRWGVGGLHHLTKFFSEVLSFRGPVESTELLIYHHLVTARPSQKWNINCTCIFRAKKYISETFYLRHNIWRDFSPLFNAQNRHCASATVFYRKVWAFSLSQLPFDMLKSAHAISSAEVECSRSVTL